MLSFCVKESESIFFLALKNIAFYQFKKEVAFMGCAAYKNVLSVNATVL